MNRAESELARGCYGYGRWKATYWFIGPEQGQSASENNNLTLRHKAFRKLEKHGLCDCGAFHHAIHEERWHRVRPALQPTWRRLILLLMTFLEKKRDNESLRGYQRDRWGKRSGDTCVIELSGLPARNQNVAREREAFREKRIELIRQKMLACKPVFVVMYGKGAMKYWKGIGSNRLSPGCAQKIGSTIFVVATHPVARGLGKKYWVKLGQRMLRESRRRPAKCK
jgi:hypothetical protein